MAVLALAVARAQIPAGDVRERDGRLPAGFGVGRGTAADQLALDGRDGLADWAGVVFVQVFPSGVGWPWRAGWEGPRAGGRA